MLTAPGPCHRLITIFMLMRQDSDVNVDDDETWLGRNDVSRGVAYLSHPRWAVKDTISIANIKEAQNICRIVSTALWEPLGVRMKTSASSLLCSCQWPSCCGQGGQKYAMLNTVEYFWALWNTVEYWIHESFTHQVGSVSALHTPLVENVSLWKILICTQKMPIYTTYAIKIYHCH